MTEYESYYYVVRKGRNHEVCSTSYKPLAKDINYALTYKTFEMANEERRILDFYYNRGIKITQKGLEFLENEKQTRA